MVVYVLWGLYFLVQRGKVSFFKGPYSMSSCDSKLNENDAERCTYADLADHIRRRGLFIEDAQWTSTCM
jgi:hypothetical protein